MPIFSPPAACRTATCQLPSSWPAAPHAPGVASTLNLCGAFDSSPPTPPPLQRCRFRPRRARAPAPHRRRRRRRSAAAVAAAAQGPPQPPRSPSPDTTLSSSATVEMARLCGTVYIVYYYRREALVPLHRVCYGTVSRTPVLRSSAVWCTVRCVDCALSASGGSTVAAASRLSRN